MRNITLILIIGVVVLAGTGYFIFSRTKKIPTATESVSTPPLVIVIEKEVSQTPRLQSMPLTITSPSFQMNSTIPALFTCDGKNISPELNFSNIPDGTQSLALIMEDPDVPKTIRADGMWNHWIAWNISPQTTRVEEGKTPPGIVGINTSGKTAYTGPCPPDREHRYIFTLYALNAMFSLPKNSTKEELLKTIAPHIIEKATLIGLYNRK